MKEHVVSFSGGKDSTAMLLMMIEKDMPINEIVFLDTGKEFLDMYKHIDKVEKHIGRPIVRLHPEKSFDYWFAEHIKTKGKFKGQKGYGWMGPKIRWCTRVLKQEVWRKYFKGRDVIKYLGIAYDEQKRMFANRTNSQTEKYPLVEWEVTEAEALQYCYDKGFDWNGLYRLFRRVSCYCCSMSGIPELKNLFLHFPKLWAELLELDKKSLRPFRPHYTLDGLDKRFREETLQGRNV